MKMEAMQKRRMWKVAIVHFALSLLAFWELLHFASYFGPSEQFKIFEIWQNLWVKMVFALQPQCLIPLLLSKGIKIDPSGMISRIIFCYLVMSIPIWSFCFAWLYVKFTNWLKHFPVLGQKVF
jgi:hypothetical protein